VKATNRIINSATGADRRARKQFIRSLKETAARAVVTASVTFAVGWVLKRMFEKSVSKAAQEGAKSGVEDQLTPSVPVAGDSPLAASNRPSEPK
jgi:uncharacterized protein (DUF697 family)